MRAPPSDIISNWHHRVEGLSIPPDTFYATIEQHLADHNAEKVKVDRVHFAEGGILSAKREYLQVRRGEHVFHVCAAPFGNGFFVSWWLGRIESGFFAWLATLPVVGRFLHGFLNPVTYFSLDTAFMFQSLTASCVERALNDAVEAKGLRALSPEQYKPTIRDMLGALAGAR